MSEGLEFVEHEARFWENRYRVQHKTVHKLEDALAAERQHRERLEEALREIATRGGLDSTKTGRPLEGWDCRRIAKAALSENDPAEEAE